MPRPPAGHRRIWGQALQQWEAKHRTHGGDRSNVSDAHVEPDGHSARGIRRRLQKRANAGDEQAQRQQHGRPLTPGPFNASRL